MISVADILRANPCDGYDAAVIKDKLGGDSISWSGIAASVTLSVEEKQFLFEKFALATEVEWCMYASVAVSHYKRFADGQFGESDTSTYRISLIIEKCRPDWRKVVIALMRDREDVCLRMVKHHGDSHI